jgi:hypothetical protein
MGWRISTMSPLATPPTPPTPELGTSPAGQMEDLPWTGITVMIAVMSLLLFMAVPMTGPTEEERASAQLERRCFVALQELHTAINDYQGDHGSWPGQTAASIRSLAPAVFDAYAFEQQLQLNTDLSGSVLPSGGDSHPFGPYLPNSIPSNPLNGLNTVRVLQPGESIHESNGRGYGWVYNPENGEIQRANRGPGSRK